MPEPTDPPVFKSLRGTLLIVDDEDGPRESLRTVFKDQYHVLLARGGAEALQLAARHRVDVAILDIMLPDIHGTEVLRALKERDPHLEVIMLTGFESVDSARASVRYGATDYLSKPWDVPQVRELVGQCLAKRRQAVDAAAQLRRLEESAPPLVLGTERTAPLRPLPHDKLPPHRPAVPRRASAATADQPAIHWREYSQILLERKWILGTVLVAVVTLALIWNFKATRIYRSTTRVQVESENLNVLNKIQDVVTTDTRDVQYLNTQLKILSSRTLAEQVVKAMGLDKQPQFLPHARPPTDFAEALRHCLSAQLVRDTRLIDISAEHPRPEMAAALANGVASEFIKQNLDQKLGSSLDAVRWLRQQAEEHKTKVEKSELAIQEYRERTGVVSLEEDQNIVVEKLKELSSAVTKAKTERLAAEMDWNKVKALTEAGQDLVAIPTIAEQAPVTALRQQLTAKQIAASTLRERYLPKHPTMVAALTEIQLIQEKLAKACGEAAETLHNNYLVAKSKEESLLQALREQEQLSLDLSRKLIDYGALKRNALADKQLYDSILTRMKEAGVTGQLDINNIRVVDSARPPPEPYKPRVARNLALAVVLGLIGGLALSFAVHFYDDKIKSYQDVEFHLQLPVLASVPTIKQADESDRDLVTQRDPRSFAAEAFRNLRAGINLSQAARATQRFLITSTAPGEGKSLVAANLAIVFAHNNQRTLLIDADLRHPTQQRAFKINTQLGLSGFLAEATSLEAVVQPTEVPNLDVIVCGAVPANPPELLGSGRMARLLEEAGQTYERIVLDSPPVTAVSDPLILLPYVQGTVFVVHFNKIRRDVVARAVQKLRESGVPLVGAVLNNLDLERHGYYHYPYHYSAYYGGGQKDRGKRSRRRPRAPETVTA